MPFTDSEKRKEYQNRWNQEHKEERKEYQNRWYQEHKEDHKEYYKKYNQEQKQPVVYAYTEAEDFDKYVYIGSTSNLKERLRKRLKCNHPCNFDLLYRERPENFTLHIIEQFETMELARAKEKQLTKELQPKYNIRNR